MSESDEDATPTERLARLGIQLPQIVAPVGSYAPARRSGSYIFTSGQLPMVGGAMAATGKVGGTVAPDVAKDMARACALNALAAIAGLVDLDSVRRVVKVVGYVASTADFTGQPAVVNGASDVLAQIFGSEGVHARSAVGVVALPLDAPVEVELIVEVG
jgi:enamine deaminase RidA (YjgF/YER057c/UK114 family)